MNEYEEKYGERIMSDWQEREEQERIESKEKLENYEKCIERIKELIEGWETEPIEEWANILYEIKGNIEELENV